MLGSIQINLLHFRGVIGTQAKVLVNTNNDLKKEDKDLPNLHRTASDPSGESPRKWLCDTSDSATQHSGQNAFHI